MTPPVELLDPRDPDMSPEAIATRLQMVDELRRLTLSLRAAGKQPSKPAIAPSGSLAPVRGGEGYTSRGHP
jgi:hypothetical protein